MFVTEDALRSLCRYVFLASLGDDTLVVMDPIQLNVSAWNGKSGAKMWESQVATTGVLRGGVSSNDGTTLVVWGDAGVFVVRGGRLVYTIGVSAETVSVAPDGSMVAVTTVGASKLATGVEVYDIAKTQWKLVWSFRASEYIRNPTFGPSGSASMLVFGTDLGEVYVK